MRFPAFRPAAALLLLACSLFAQSTVPPNLAGQWHFSEGSGTSTADSAGANTGTLTGTVAWVPGLWGTAVRPDGTTGYVDVGSNAAMNIAANSAFSISCWINIPATEAEGPIVSMRNTANDNSLIDLCVGFEGLAAAPGTGGTIKAIVRDDVGPSGAYVLVSSGTMMVNDGTWHHVALTRNAGTTVELFVDGVSKGTATGAGGAITSDRRFFGAEPAWISGGSNTADQRFLNGTIEEVQFYTRQLSLSDVQTLAAPPAPTNLSATAGNGTVSLTWTASPTATSYIVKRGTAMGGPFTALPGATPTGTSYTDSTATNGTTWFYVVDAVRGTTTSTDSNVVSASPVAPIPRTEKLGSDHPCGCSTIPPIEAIPFAVWALLAAGLLVLAWRRVA